MVLQAPARTLLAWSLWLATFGCCAGGLVVTLAVTRPLSVGVLAEGAAFALAFPLGFASVGLVLSLRRPANPIGWMYAAASLAWSWSLPFEPWSLAPGPLQSTPIANPFGLAGMAGTVAIAVGAVGVVLHWGSLPAVREQLDLDALKAELLAVVDQTVQPTQASLWLHPAAAAVAQPPLLQVPLAVNRIPKPGYINKDRSVDAPTP